MQTIKENAIRDYVSDIDFKSENWSLKSIKEDLRKFLGEEPAIDVIYVMINEATKKPVEFLNVDKVEIIFYDIDEKFKKITINP